MKRMIALSVSALCVIALAGCGGSGSSADAADYTQFCGVASKMEGIADDPHGEDPAAITEAEVMKSTWSKMVALAEQLRDISPDDVKADVTLMVSTMVDMNKIFEANNYELLEMAKDEDVRKQLEAISTREGVEEASQRFDAFMEKNCTSTSQ